jgi:hypothetical protein
MFEPSIIIAWVLATASVLAPVIFLLKRGHINNWQANIGLFVLSICYYILIESIMGYPKPFVWELDQGRHIEVLAYRSVPGVVVYLWVLREGETVPRAYTLSWPQAQKRGLGKDLSEQGSEARRKGKRLYYGRDNNAPKEQPKLQLEGWPDRSAQKELGGTR